MARCGLFYNATLFQQGGVPLPTDDWTYDDMRSAAQRLTKRAGADVDVWGGGRNFGGDFSFMAVTRAFGGDLYTKDGKKTLLASEPSRQAISWWLDRYPRTAPWPSTRARRPRGCSSSRGSRPSPRATTRATGA